MTDINAILARCAAYRDIASVASPVTPFERIIARRLAEAAGDVEALAKRVGELADVIVAKEKELGLYRK